jgi:hypothetical protein
VRLVLQLAFAAVERVVLVAPRGRPQIAAVSRSRWLSSAAS